MTHSSSEFMTPMMQQVVANFGEMGSRWGINRTVGQIYALLVLSESPLNADQISEALSISRSNVSMGLKELGSWQLLTMVHYPGDRKDYFSAPDDIWQIARTLIAERRKREIDPTLSVLRDALMQTPQDSRDEYAQKRIHQMHDLMEQLTQLSEEFNQLSTEQLTRLLKLGAGIGKVLEFKGKLTGKS